MQFFFEKDDINGLSECLEFCNERVILKSKKEVIFLCIGTDKIIGDSFGPIVGHFLKQNNYTVYGDLENRLPNTSSIAFKGVKADELLLMLESFNIFISTGSACNSEIALPSHVLTACKADLENYSPIRISLGKYNTKEEIDIFVKSLINIVNMIRRRG